MLRIRIHNKILEIPVDRPIFIFLARCSVKKTKILGELRSVSGSTLRLQAGSGSGSAIGQVDPKYKGED
jgi:hypothetical protein